MNPIIFQVFAAHRLRSGVKASSSRGRPSQVRQLFDDGRAGLPELPCQRRATRTANPWGLDQVLTDPLGRPMVCFWGIESVREGFPKIGVDVPEKRNCLGYKSKHKPNPNMCAAAAEEVLFLWVGA